ncbi:unnamed protein product [Pleuronectes platessa]|uniref:Uncharacterized protein n=1 Tax=Pleuronectes platessa TaxID=8262 RepID=A0A9N7UY20_PLEPL|nr:unnamed protein product [Pleuronectes platessa]
MYGCAILDELDYLIWFAVNKSFFRRNRGSQPAGNSTHRPRGSAPTHSLRAGVGNLRLQIRLRLFSPSAVAPCLVHASGHWNSGSDKEPLSIADTHTGPGAPPPAPAHSLRDTERSELVHVKQPLSD